MTLPAQGQRSLKGPRVGGGECVANIRPNGYHIGYHDTCPITGLLFSYFVLNILKLRS